MTSTRGTQVEVLSRELQRVTAENNDLHQQVRSIGYESNPACACDDTAV